MVSSSRSRWIVGFVLLFSVCASARAVTRWRDGAVTHWSRVGPAAVKAKLESLRGEATTRRVVVALERTPTKEQRERLEAAGVRLLSSLGGRAWFATLGPQLDAQRASSLGLVDATSIPVGHKLHPDLAAGIVRPWTVVPPDPERTAAEPRVAVVVTFHEDVDPDSAASRVAQRHGGKLRSVTPSIHAATIHLPADRIPALAAEDEVMWVEPPLPRLGPTNQENRAVVQAEDLQAPPLGLDGSGVTVLVFDGGTISDHDDFQGRYTIGAGDTSDPDASHATHVAGTIGGDGSASGGQYRGMAPAVQLISYGLEQHAGLQAGFLYTDPRDLERDYREALELYDIDIANNSIGSNVAINLFPCDWEGDYGATSRLIDSIVRGSLGRPLTVVWAAGNERGGAVCGTAFNTMAPPAGNKNAIVVGALNSDTEQVTGFSSYGPTDDGSLGPDLCAPGCQTDGDEGVTSTLGIFGYQALCGTSMSAPTVTGLVALLLQHYRASYPSEPDPLPSTFKAILAQTAADAALPPLPGPDFLTGYGGVKGLPAAELITDGRFLEGSVAQGETYQLTLVVGAGEPSIKVTLAWDDAPGTPNVVPSLVNDLDLRIIGPSGTVYYPWTLDPSQPIDPAVRTQRDARNNLEQVVIDNPPEGTYRVEIEGFDVAAGPNQPFSLATSHEIVHCAPRGTLAISASPVGCDDVLTLRANDCGLDLDSAQIDTATVDVVSASDPTGETVVLTETAVGSGLFEGTLELASTDVAGRLQVADGDTVSATYVDADDGEGGTDIVVTSQSSVDCVAPAVTGVNVVQALIDQADVSVSTDGPVRATVHYGTSCTATSNATYANALDDEHTLRLVPLPSNTTTFFRVEVSDEAGNVAFDDNGGSCYTVTTLPRWQYLTEWFCNQSIGTPDLDGLQATFIPDGSSSFYSTCTEPLSGGQLLPTLGATPVDLSTGDQEPLSLTGGQTVPFFGVDYDTVSISRDGYAILGPPAIPPGSLIEWYFGAPRVAPFVAGQNQVSGQASWQQLTDRVVLTWEDWDYLSNNYQVELFYDGRVRLRWKNLDTSCALVGLSDGQGLDPEFVEYDFSSGGSCPPRPPDAIDVSFQVPSSTPTSIGLYGDDDGSPGPLTYSVLSLPLAGQLIDAETSEVILSVPHVLGGGASTLTYDPADDYIGADGFTYTVDDGGTPPDGGTSQPGNANLDVVLGGNEAAFQFLVDDTDPGWVTTGDWAFGQPTGGGNGLVGYDPTSGYTGQNVYGYNLAGLYASNMGVETLTTPALDLTGWFSLELRFQRRLGVQSADNDHAKLEISTDGSAWTTLWENPTSNLVDFDWTPVSYDISAIADDQPTVFLRWSMGPTDFLNNYPGWNIDDVEIVGEYFSDCDPGDPDTIRPPVEVANLKLAGAPSTSLTWHDQGLIAGPAVTYDVLAGDIDDFGVDPASGLCLSSAIGASYTEDRLPVSGRGYWYLVRAGNSCGISTLGSAERDADYPDLDEDGRTDICP